MTQKTKFKFDEDDDDDDLLVDQAEEELERAAKSRSQAKRNEDQLPEEIDLFAIDNKGSAPNKTES